MLQGQWRNVYNDQNGSILADYKEKSAVFAEGELLVHEHILRDGRRIERDYLLDRENPSNSLWNETVLDAYHCKQ